LVSSPNPVGSAKASPDNLRMTRFQRGRVSLGDVAIG